MFKKSGAILLTMLYVITAMGFVLNLHYCGKTITAVKIDAPANGCKTNMIGSKMKCCRQKHIDIKIKDSHVGEFPSFLGKLFSFHIARLPFTEVVFNIPVAPTQATTGRAPPGGPSADDTPLFVKNCTFRI